MSSSAQPAQAHSRTRSRHFRLWVVLGTGGVVVIGMLALYIAHPMLLQQLDRKIYDAFLISRPQTTPSPVPAIIDIDERSLNTYGQWPWPRYLMARLVERLTEQGAAAVGLDILLSEADRSSPAHLRSVLQRDFGLNVEFSGLSPQLEDNDALLAQVLQQSPVVLGQFMRFTGTPEIPADLPRPTGLAEQTPPGCPSPREYILTAHGALLPMPMFQEVAPVGAINVAPDPDGLIRSVPLLTQLGGNIYANLSLRTLMRGMDVNTLILRSGPDGLEQLRIGPLTIPVSPIGTINVPFRGPHGVYPYFSAVDVLQGRVPTEDIEGRILFIGTSAAGLQDIRSTPFDAVYPGVETHATVVDAILSGEQIVKPAWTPGAQMLSIFLAGIAAALACGLASPAVYLPLNLSMAGGATLGSAWLFRTGVFLSPLYVILTVGAEALVLLSLRFWQEERQKRVLRQAFSRYVAPEVVNRIAERGGDVFAGEEREVTVMFTDVRGFTTLSEGLRPEQVVSLLNRYLTPMTACIRNNDGTLDKFIGDAIMAFWNAPLDVPNHPERAVRTVLRMREILQELNASLEQEFGVRLRVGAGLHTGRVFVGNMGSEDLLDYTCIGDNVNLASRLEGLSSKYGVDIVVSGATADRCPEDLYFRPLDTIRVKGKTHPVDIYTVLQQTEAALMAEELRAAEAALACYRQGEFPAALRQFQELRRQYPHNDVLYALYAARCLELETHPPALWEGIWTFESK